MSYRPYSVIIQQAISQSASLSTSLTNNSGSTISAWTPVRSDVNGEMNTIDPTFESQARSVVGVTSESILDGASGLVVLTGKIEQVESLGFSLGDEIFISKTGTLTNLAPSNGVGGFVSGDVGVRMGVIVKNTDNPAYQDLLVNVTIIGQIS